MKAEKSKKFQREKKKKWKEGRKEWKKEESVIPYTNINYLYLPPSILFEDTSTSPRNGKLKICYKENSP